MKAQVNVVAVLSITLIVLVLTSIGYFWAAPLINEAVDFQKKEQMGSDMIRLYDAVIRVANDKSKASETIDVVAGQIQLRNVSVDVHESDLFNNSQTSWEIGPLTAIVGDGADANDFAYIEVPVNATYRSVKFKVNISDTGSSEFRAGNINLDVGNDGGTPEFSSSFWSGLKDVDATSAVNSLLPFCNCTGCSLSGGACTIAIKGWWINFGSCTFITPCPDSGKLNLSQLDIEGYLNTSLSVEWEANLNLPTEFLGSEQVIKGDRVVINQSTGESNTIGLGVGEIGLDPALMLVRKGYVRYNLIPRVIIDKSSEACRGIRFKPGDIAIASEGMRRILFEWAGSERVYSDTYNFTYDCDYIDFENIKVTVR